MLLFSFWTIFAMFFFNSFSINFCKQCAVLFYRQLDTLAQSHLRTWRITNSNVIGLCYNYFCKQQKTKDTCVSHLNGKTSKSKYFCISFKKEVNKIRNKRQTKHTQSAFWWIRIWNLCKQQRPKDFMSIIIEVINILNRNGNLLKRSKPMTKLLNSFALLTRKKTEYLLIFLLNNYPLPQGIQYLESHLGVQIVRINRVLSPLWRLHQSRR